MKRLIFYFIFISIGFVVALISDPPFKDIATGLVVGIFLILIDILIQNQRWGHYCWWSVKYFNTYIRLSISYLYRIKIDDEYFLVRGIRIPDQFQPVGGVYKRLDSSSNFFHEIKALDDNLLPIDKSSKNDLRIRIKGKHLVKFIKWFELSVDREIDPWREFYEELVATGLLDRNRFPYLLTKKIKTEINKFSWSDYAQSSELFIADIFEAQFNEEQINEIKKLKIKKSNSYLFVGEEQIKRLGFIPKQNNQIKISKSASWLI